MKKILEAIKINLTKWQLCLTAIILAAFFIFQFSFISEPSLIEKWSLCLKLLKERALYGGQPMCVNGPFSYLALLFISLAGQFSTLFGYITIYALYGVLFYFILKILRKENMRFSFLFLVLSFALFVILPAKNSFDGVLAAVFLIIGCYLLLYSHSIKRSFLGGIALAAAVHTKMNLLIFVGIFLFIYTFHFAVTHTNKKIHLNKFALLKLLAAIAAILFVTLVLIAIFPKLLIYTFFINFDITDSPSNDPYLTSFSFANVLRFFTEPLLSKHMISLNYPDMIYRLSFIDAQVIFVMLYSIMVLLIFLRNRTKWYQIFSFLGFITFSVVSLARYNFFALRYFIPISPFFVLSLQDIRGESKKLYNLFIFITFWLLVYSLIMTARFEIMTNTSAFKELKAEVASGTTFLPRNVSLLTDVPSILSDAGYQSDGSDVEQYPLPLAFNGHRIDPDQAILLERQNILTEEWKNYRDIPYKNMAQIVNNIVARKYDIIFIGPSHYNSRIFQDLLQIKKQIELQNSSYANIVSYDCGALLPTAAVQCKTCIHSTLAYFKNRTLCEEMRLAVYNHYLRIFNSICAKDSFIANFIIKPTMQENVKSNSTFVESIGKLNCPKGKNRLYISTASKGIVNSMGDVIFLFALLPIMLTIFWLQIRSSRRNKGLS